VSARGVAAGLSTAVGGLALAVGAGTTLARLLPGVPGVAPDTWAMVTSFTDAGALAYLVALLGLGGAVLLRRHRGRLVAGVLAVVLAAVHLTWLVPGWVADDRPAAGTGRLTVLAQNMLFGGADPAALVAAAADADVLVLTEVTEPARLALEAAGVRERFPHQAGDGSLPRSGPSGTHVYSRFPLSAEGPLDARIGDHHWRADVAVPGLGAVTVVAVHPQRPVRGGDDWAGEQEQVRRALPRTRAVVAGDFNAVDAHPTMRRLRADGFRDSDDLVGAGWNPTYPAQGLVPPLIAIDHVLVSDDLTATAFGTVDLPGTDHRGVLATVALRG
jgi:endonuclease/exonuclease/phosphatase (EEP) superfamily protein YafD